MFKTQYMRLNDVLEEIVSIDYERAFSFIEKYVLAKVEEAGVNKVVVGLSGGLDSSVTLKILVETLGANSVLALIMPDLRVNTVEDVDDAVDLARSLNVEYRVVMINGIYDAYIDSLRFTADNPIVAGNLRSRIRMCILFYYANALKALVVGTSNRSEILIGYFTKFGDGAADLYPLCTLYKTQVRELARRLKLPEKIVSKPSSPGFWHGHLAEEEIGLKYEIIDSILYLYLDKKISVENIVSNYGVPRVLVEKVLGMYRSSVHKRTLFNKCCEETPFSALGQET